MALRNQLEVVRRVGGKIGELPRLFADFPGRWGEPADFFATLTFLTTNDNKPPT